ncbi:MAG: M15 family metallopeptidase [Cyanobacteria bacterium J06648_11]
MLIVLSLLVAIASSNPRAAESAEISLSERLELLRLAYRDYISDIDATHVIMKDGSRILIDDGRQKSHMQRLVSADIEDMLSQVYPLLDCMSVDAKPARNFDPGRIRNEAFFRAVYGGDRRSAGRQLATVRWFGRPIRFTAAAGADEALAKVANELATLQDLDSQLVSSIGGTFNWRRIAGTNRLSVHSFGAAIDLNVKFADYWRWSGGKPGSVPSYQNRIPANVIRVFEKHNFIWGGRWYHYDTMHFEYRPELTAIARLAQRRGC